MKVTNFVSSVKQLIGEDKLAQAIGLLQQFMADKEEYNDVIIQSARFHSIEKQLRQSTVAQAVADVEKNKIRAAVLDIADEVGACYKTLRKESQASDEKKTKYARVERLQKMINDYEDKLMMDDDPMRQMQYEKKIEMLGLQKAKIIKELKKG